jgi:hypothetical protein
MSSSPSPSIGNGFSSEDPTERLETLRLYFNDHFNLNPAIWNQIAPTLKEVLNGAAYNGFCTGLEAAESVLKEYVKAEIARGEEG